MKGSFATTKVELGETLRSEFQSLNKGTPDASWLSFLSATHCAQLIALL